MDHDVAVVQQHPGAVPVALPAEDLDPAFLLQILLHGAAEGVDLGVGAAGGNDEIIRQGRNVGDLNGGNLLALLLVQRFGGQNGQFLRCHHTFKILSECLSRPSAAVLRSQGPIPDSHRALQVPPAAPR